MRYDYLLSLAMQLVTPLLERRYNTIHLQIHVRHLIENFIDKKRDQDR